MKDESIKSINKKMIGLKSLRVLGWIYIYSNGKFVYQIYQY